jgi:peptidoglycan hydrolase-like protein with peptidoglycan-binding domain
MANYNQVSYGSRGTDVTELQKLLNKNGYTLSEDGIFGNLTKNAVMDYQKKKGLAVDGIVGVNTWGALTKADTNATTEDPNKTNPAPTEPAKPKYEYPEYTPSEAVTKAEELLAQLLQNKPSEYKSSWQEKLNEIIEQITNREKFSYDINGDALYQQYKNQYTTQGKMAMMDTMGQAQAMTGGYGNSYAQNVGQQAYQGYLQGLNDKIPELYQLALNQYNAEGDAMYDQFALMAQQEDQDYGRYRDSLSDYYTELERLYNQYNTERDYDYEKWANERGFNYQRERDEIEDDRWEKEFEEAKRQFELQYNLSASKSSGGGGGGYSGGGSTGGTKTGQYTGTNYSNAGYSVDIIKQVQKMLGVKEDGIWGPQSQAALERNGFKDLQTFVESRGLDNPGNDKPNGDKVTYSTIVSELNTFIKNGANKSKISSYLRSAYQAGYITQAEYNKLKNQFVPRGSTY